MMREINYDSQFLMVTGVARSGTTLLAQCLQHHPKLMCPPDPMNELFRAFNHFAYYKVHGQIKNPLVPMDHFFFSGSTAVRAFLEKTDFCHEIPPHLRVSLLERISRRGGRYCPEIKERVLHCKSKTFDSLYLEIMGLLCESYGKGECIYFGFKDAWCEHLISPLSRTFPNMKFINLIRDPRAVVSSNYFSSSSYPVLFSVRDWRKSIYYTWRYHQHESLMNNRFCWLRYEELINNPEKKLTEICDFLGIAYSSAMLEENFEAPNTSYQKEKRKEAGFITAAFRDSWKDRLPLGIRLKVELLCGPEMKKMGYADVYPHKGFMKALTALFGKEVEFEKLGDWCKQILPPRFLYHSIWTWWQYGIEGLRSMVYHMKIPSRGLVNKLYLDKDYFSWINC